MNKTKMKKIDLNVATRLMLLMNLPEQGSITDNILDFVEAVQSEN